MLKNSENIVRYFDNEELVETSKTKGDSTKYYYTDKDGLLRIVTREKLDYVNKEIDVSSLDMSKQYKYDNGKLKEVSRPRKSKEELRAEWEVKVKEKMKEETAKIQALNKLEDKQVTKKKK